MGLDMYLYLRKDECIGRWEKDFAEKKKNFYPEELEGFQEKIELRNFLDKEELYQVGYWRKANAIHNWFVEKCGRGIDEQQKIYVPYEKVKELKQIVDKVLENHTLASSLLPTQAGFFFGSQSYDDWYFEYLKYTQELLDDVINLLDKNNKYDVIYQASW